MGEIHERRHLLATLVALVLVSPTPQAEDRKTETERNSNTPTLNYTPVLSVTICAYSSIFFNDCYYIYISLITVRSTYWVVLSDRQTDKQTHSPFLVATRYCIYSVLMCTSVFFLRSDSACCHPKSVVSVAKERADENLFHHG